MEMKRFLFMLCLSMVALSAPSIRAQGGLTPTNAPGPTMKTLQQVEPRIPIGTTPYAITASGSYYLTSDISGFFGITVLTNNVTIDLMGFTLSGEGSTSGISISGSSNAPRSNIVIRNGAILGFNAGIALNNADHVHIKDMRISRNNEEGIDAINVRFSRIDRCISSANNIGIRLRTQGSGETTGVVVDSCVLSSNSSWGILLQSFDATCQGNRISDCMVVENDGTGIALSKNASYNEIIRCSSINNESTGISIAAVGTVCEGNTVLECTVRGNSTRGIYVDGAHAGRIEQNHVSHTRGTTTWGIWTEGTTNNVICRNVCTDHTYNFLLSPDDQAAPVVTGFNSGGLGSLTDAWSNFDF